MASMLKIGTFGDWVGLFEDWRREIGVNPKEVSDFKFETLYGAIETVEIQFGHYKRQLGSFKEDVDNWLDFFCYTDFVDRDGKFQLQMLKYSAFAPLGRSMSYMLREEAFHMGTGNTGLQRIAEAGVLPGWLMQKYLNKWVSSASDLFCTEHSFFAPSAYCLGLKGRRSALKNLCRRQLRDLNDYSRRLYHDEV